MTSTAIPDLDRATRALLETHRFSQDRFLHLQEELRSGRFGAERNRVTSPVALPEENDLLRWPQDNSTQANDWNASGQNALRHAEVGVVILNGGMATRFGGKVKGVVEVLDGQSFLGLRLRQLAQLGSPVTVFLMNSFATDEKTREHLAEHDHFGLDPARVHLLTQRISLRLTPDGGLFRDNEGRVSPYAPGHGDVFEVVGESDGLARFVAEGGKYLVVGNVDNLGATLDPKVIGAHIASGRGVTVELAERNHGDKGGAPVHMDGRIQVLEGFRFPKDFEIDRCSVFNTNTMTVGVDVFASEHDLTWFRADKNIGGSPVVQFERLMGEVTSFVDSAYLVVPRSGTEDRFMPVKTPDDLETMRPAIAARLA